MQSIVIQSLIVIVWFELDLPKMYNKFIKKYNKWKINFYDISS